MGVLVINKTPLRKKLSIIAAAITLSLGAVGFALQQIAHAEPAALYSGQTLYSNGASKMVSPDGHYTLIVQTDGNVVDYAWPRPLWSTKTACNCAVQLEMQGDGNLVLYKQAGHIPVWSSNTAGNYGAYAVLQNDGNLVVVSASGKPLWANGAVDTRLDAGQLLNPGWQIQSADRRYRMVMQGDGNLVVYDGLTPTWASGTNKSGSAVEMQGDGNLVIYAPGHVPVWASSTNKAGSALEAQTDGNFVIYAPGHVAVWSTKGSGGGGGTTSTGLLGGTDRDLASKILSSGKVTGDSRYIGQIQAYADGKYGCHINPTILSLIWTIVAPSNVGGFNHSISISSLNRKCTGVLTSSGTSSYHYRDSGGHAVDINKVDGVWSTGATGNDVNMLKQIMGKLPSGSGLGQVQCRANVRPVMSFTTPAGVTQFNDSCDHNHIQVPVR